MDAPEIAGERGGADDILETGRCTPRPWAEVHRIRPVFVGPRAATTADLLG